MSTALPNVPSIPAAQPPTDSRAASDDGPRSSRGYRLGHRGARRDLPPRETRRGARRSPGLAKDLSGPVAAVCNRGLTAQPVAEALRKPGVDAVVVREGVRGWIAALQSRVVDLGVDGLVVRQIQRPGRGCLSYLLAAGGHALVVDPAPDVGFYLRLAQELDSRITDVFDTHLHADHLSGARMLSEQTGATLRLPTLALERGVAYAAEVEPLHDGDAMTLGPITLRTIALPGHTTDMTGLLVADRALIAGDSLFLDGIARPDLQQGDPEGARAMGRILHQTLRDRVLALGENVVLLPGHTHPGVLADAVASPWAMYGRRSRSSRSKIPASSPRGCSAKCRHALPTTRRSSPSTPVFIPLTPSWRRAATAARRARDRDT